MHAGLPVVCAANATTQFQGTAVCRFLPTISGNITIQRTSPTGAVTIILNAMPVVAGVWVDLGFRVGQEGGQIITAGAAAGTLVTN